MKKFLKRIFSLGLTLALICTSNTSAFAATSFLGTDDELSKYSNDFKDLSSESELVRYIYTGSDTSCFVDLPAVATQWADHGGAYRDGNHIHGWLKMYPNCVTEGVDIHSTALGLEDWDLFVVKETTNFGRPTSIRTRKVNGVDDEGAIALKEVGNTLFPEDNGKYADNIMNGHVNSFWVSIGHMADDPDGSTKSYDIYQIYVRKGGVVVEIDPNGGRYNNSSSKQLKYYRAKKQDQTREKLDLNIPVRDGYVFCGWDVVTDWKYFEHDSTHKYSFNADGTKLLVDLGPTWNAYYRYDIKLKAHWEKPEDAKSTLIINNDNGSDKINITKTYLEKTNITIPSKAGNTVYFNTNAVNGDSVTLDKTSLTSQKTFSYWEKPKNVYGYFNTEGTQYTFLGYKNQSTEIKAKYNDIAITLPTPKSSKRYEFVGWFDTKVPNFTGAMQLKNYMDHLVAEPGKPAKITDDLNGKTLYAGWCHLEINYEKLGLTTDGKRNEKGLTSWNTVAMDSAIDYRVYKTKEPIAATQPSKAHWQIAPPFGTDIELWKKSASDKDGEHPTKFQAPATGYYYVTVNGGAGGAGGGSGGQGASINATLYLKRGDTLTYNVATNGSKMTNGQGGAGANGGGQGYGILIKCSGGEDQSYKSKDLNLYNSDGAKVGTWHFSRGDFDRDDCDDHYGLDCLYFCENCDAPCTTKPVFHAVPPDGRGAGCSGYSSKVPRSAGGYDVRGSNKYWYHRQTNKPAGGGGGSTELFLNGSLIIAAGGGDGSSQSSNGANASRNGVLSSVEQWNANKQGINAGSQGQGGGGSGRGYNYYKNSEDCRIVSTSLTSAPGVSITYYDYSTHDNKMQVQSNDENAPNAVVKSTIKVKTINQNDVSLYDIDLKHAIDNGTTWYYMVSMDANKSSSTTLQDSNVAKTTVTSQVSGYRFLTDNVEGTKITLSNGTYQACGGDPEVVDRTDTLHNVKIDASHTYLHVAPIDFAGNLGPTTTILVPQYFPVTCFDINEVNAKQILGNKYNAINITGYDCIPGTKNGVKDGSYLFRIGTQVSATVFGTIEDLDKYYTGYYYKAGSATTITVQRSTTNRVERYFYPTEIYTNQIKLTGGNNWVDPRDASGKTYFVKHDTDFTLEYDGITVAKNVATAPKDGKAPATYQVNSVYYDMTTKNNGSHLTEVKLNNNVYNTTSAEKNNGNLIELGSVKGVRSSNGTTVNFKQVQQVTENKDNIKITVTPEARAYHSETSGTVTRSSRSHKTIKDTEHIVNIICDSTAPTINGPSIYDEEADDFNPLIEAPTTIPIHYIDYVKNVNPSNPEYGSGVKPNNGQIKVTLIQEQTDDGGAPLIREYKEDTINKIVKIDPIDPYKGDITLTIDPKEYADMSGFITIRVEITDNVGNTAVREFRILVMHLDAKLQNIVNCERKGTNRFANGEFGDIEIETNGFIDKVDVIFPTYLDDLAKLETSNDSEFNDAQYNDVQWSYGRVLTDYYPRDKEGTPIRVFLDKQTKLWGSTHKGGMEWGGSDYVHCYLKHFFYAPIYAQKGKYTAVVYASKKDTKSERVYTIQKSLDFYIGITDDVSPDVIPPITEEFKDRINDN